MKLYERRVVICFQRGFSPFLILYSRMLVFFETLNKMEKHKAMKKFFFFFFNLEVCHNLAFNSIVKKNLFVLN
jgi:hypothetical protein